MTESTRHRWNIENIDRVPACESESGCEQTERHCEKCPLVKITVHTPDGGNPYRAWRHPKSPKMFVCEHTPPCVPRIEAQ